jgi:hypothetical protein
MQQHVSLQYKAVISIQLFEFVLSIGCILGGIVSVGLPHAVQR